MKKTIIALSLLAGFASIASFGTAEAKQLKCGQKSNFQGWKPCDRVPNTSYDGGGVQIKSVSATACFNQEIYHVITRPDGSNEFVTALVYKGYAHEKVRTEHNTNCWSQNVAPGTWMSVYITCKEYTGWVAAKVTKSGKYTMQKVGWGFQPKWM